MQAPEFSCCLRTKFSLLCLLESSYLAHPFFSGTKCLLFWLYRAPWCSHSRSLSLYVSVYISLSPSLLEYLPPHQCLEQLLVGQDTVQTCSNVTIVPPKKLSHPASPRAVSLSEAPPHEKMFPQPVGVGCNSPGDSCGAHPRPAT